MLRLLLLLPVGWVVGQAKHLNEFSFGFRHENNQINITIAGLLSGFGVRVFAQWSTCVKHSKLFAKMPQHTENIPHSVAIPFLFHFRFLSGIIVN